MTELLFISNREPLAAAVESALPDSSLRALVLRQPPQKLPAARIVVVSWMGTLHEKSIQSFYIELQKRKVPFILLFTQLEQRTVFENLSPLDAETIEQYLSYGGAQNICSLLDWLNNQCGGHASFSPPQPQAWQGIYRPEQERPLSLDEFQTQYAPAGKRCIGILFPREAWVWQNLESQRKLIAAIEGNGAVALPVFTHWTRDDARNIPGAEDAINSYFCRNGRPQIDALINLLWFSLSVGRNLKNPLLLQRLGVPILQGQTLVQDMAEWNASESGLTPVELTANVVMPEFDGVVHGTPVAWRKKTPRGELRWQPIDDGIDRLAARALKWAALRQKKNHDKKVAILLHNYPPGNASLGTAIALDSPASVEKLLRRLAAEGYQVGSLPETDGWLIEELAARTTNDRLFLCDSRMKRTASWPVQDANRYFSALPPEAIASLRKQWGMPPGEIMVENGGLLIPGCLKGNVFIGIQPPRGFHDAPETVYHSPDLPPPYYYLGYYQWLRDSFSADAVIHIGTHGSLEWLPGKSSGLSSRCYPDIALAELPNIYPYLITVVCEGLQAKRRSAAVLVSHLPAPTTKVEIYGPLEELERLLDETAQTPSDNWTALEILQQLIDEKLTEAALDQQLPKRSDEAASDYHDRLHRYLQSLKTEDVRCGLHILGRSPQNETLEQYLAALCNVENGDIPSLPQTVAALLDQDYNALRDSCTKDCVTALAEIEDHCRRLIRCVTDSGQSAIAEIRRWNWRNRQAFNQLETVYNWLCDVALPALQSTTAEEESIIQALQGNYIAAGPAGAPSAGMADVLPTGRNFYGVDPRSVPTVAAWRLGRQLTELLLQRHIADTGRYPESIGMILWSGNSMRSRGQCIAQFLWLLGIEPIWQNGSGRILDLRVIPIAELGRPRIDVTVRASGMFRDSLPPVMALLDQAIELAASQPETADENYLRKHVIADCSRLQAQGQSKTEAWEEACYRIFSCRPGTYGAGVGEAIENKNWQTIDDLSKIYVEWGGYAYTRSRAGHYAARAFANRLSTLDATVKNEDNHEINMLDSDDFNAFHGGMIAAVRSLSGRAPLSYCGDSSDQSRLAVRTLDEEMHRLYRTQVLNPQFIDGMKKHGYKGAADLACVIAQSVSWSATSNLMQNWMYEEVAQQYALNPATAEWMRQANPWALRRIAEKLLEAEQRGLWQAAEKTKQDLRRLYLEIEGELENDEDY